MSTVALQETKLWVGV